MTDENEKTKAEERKAKMAAMKGARDAMAHAIDQVSSLETALDRCITLAGEMQKMIGKEAQVRSFYGNGSGQEFVSAQFLMDEMQKIRARVTSK